MTMTPPVRKALKLITGTGTVQTASKLTSTYILYILVQYIRVLNLSKPTNLPMS